jgi:hypothetical protein
VLSRIIDCQPPRPHKSERIPRTSFWIDGVVEQGVEADEAGASHGASPLNPVLAQTQYTSPPSDPQDT